MTILQGLDKILDKYDKQLGSTETKQLELLKGLPFYNWQLPYDAYKLEQNSNLTTSNTFNHVHQFYILKNSTTSNTLEDARKFTKNVNLTTGNTFNHAIGLPQKNGVEFPLFDYEQLLYNELQSHKHLWIKKATGLGITEFLLRYMAWLCFNGNGSARTSGSANISANVQNNHLSGSQMCIVTGPRIELAITLIDRMKGLFRDLTFLQVDLDTKETVIELNGVHIEAYPSHHLDAMRGLKDVSFIYQDEADFFPPGQQRDARDVSERYIGKSNPWIVMVSTPNAPEGLFERIEKEPESTCLYHRLFLDYTYGLDRIYTAEEIQAAKQSPSFEREYNLKYLGLIGNVFHTKDIEAAIEKGKKFGSTEINSYSQKSVGLDPGFGSSPFGICITEFIDGQISVLYADEYPRPDFNQMLDLVYDLIRKYNMSLENRCNIYVDGANPSFIMSLKQMLGENAAYEQEIDHYKKSSHGLTIDLSYLRRSMFVVPVHFAKEHKQMLVYAKQLLEGGATSGEGCIAIHPKFDKLITSLRTAVENGEGVLDKEATTYDDIFDAFRMSLQFYR